MHSGGSKGTTERQAAIASALRTVTTEQAGMAALAEALNGGLAEPFAHAVEVLSVISGRVIVTGVGKSGHIGSKIAATLASTGTPAFFVHPSEANHGDLGMIASDDAIIAHVMVRREFRAEGHRLLCPPLRHPAHRHHGRRGVGAGARGRCRAVPAASAPEACPHGLAPTTSTLLQLAIGDALAVALLEARGFTADHFRTFHPGGQLGANLTHVGEIMHSGDEMPVVPLGTKMPEAVMILSKKRFGCVCVIDGEGRLVGIVTDGDLARNLAPRHVGSWRSTTS